MALLDTLLSGIFNTAAISQQAHLNDVAADKQQEYNRENMAAQYNYGEQAADNADARARSFYEDYQSPQAMMKQYEQAGLNPMLMAGGSMPSASSNGAQGGGTGLPSVSVSPVDISSLAGLAEINSRIALNEANARNADARARESDSVVGLNYERISQVRAEIRKLNLDSDVQEKVLKWFDYNQMMEARYKSSLIVNVDENTRATSIRVDNETRLTDAQISSINKQVERFTAEIRQINANTRKTQQDYNQLVKTGDLLVQKLRDECRITEEQANTIREQIVYECLDNPFAITLDLLNVVPDSK